MSEGAGVLRSAASLDAAAKRLADLGEARADEPGVGAGVEAWEMTNLHTVASVLVRSASIREETRGSHWREDFPETRTEWRGHLCTTLGQDGHASTEFEELR
jgi:L-aspartate oxidase